jgi:hypothetical protein
MRNRINAYILKRKANLLNLVLINIYKPFPSAFSGTRYFLKAVNNYTRKFWVIPLCSRKEVKSTFKKWRRNQELLSRSKLKAVKSDNVGELKSTLDE